MKMRRSPKKLEVTINYCAECPYNHYIDYDDVSVSFSMDWFCKIMELNTGQTTEEIIDGIREGCPLPNA